MCKATAFPGGFWAIDSVEQARKAKATTGIVRVILIILFIGSPLYGRDMITIDHLKQAAQGRFPSAFDPKADVEVVEF